MIRDKASGTLPRWLFHTTTRSAAVVEIADRAALSGITVVSILTIAVSGVENFGVGSLRGRGRCMG